MGPYVQSRRMRAALQVSERWAREGKDVAAATLVAIAGSTPRRAGARLLVSSTGDTWGSVSFGCVEADVAAHARSVLESGRPRLASYGITDEDAFAVGFTCGGTMQVFIEPWTGLHDDLGGVPAEDFAGSMGTVMSGSGTGTHALFDPKGQLVAGSIDPAAAEGLMADAATVAAGQRSQLVEREGTVIFLEPVTPSPRLIVFGAGHTAQALTTAATAIGFRVTVCDHRPELAVPELYPEADAVVLGWPHQTVPAIAPNPATYVVCLAHDLEVEEVLLPLVLAAEPRYVGVLGSKRTHATRVDRLTAAGVPEAQINEAAAHRASLKGQRRTLAHHGPLPMIGSSREPVTVGRRREKIPASMSSDLIRLRLIAALREVLR